MREKLFPIYLLPICKTWSFLRRKLAVTTWSRLMPIKSATTEEGFFVGEKVKRERVEQLPRGGLRFGFFSFA